MFDLVDRVSGLHERWTCWGFALAVMVVLVFGNVVRYAFNSGLTMSGKALARFVADVHGRCGGPEHGHLGTDALVSRLPCLGKNLSGAGPGVHAVCVVAAAQRQLGAGRKSIGTPRPRHGRASVGIFYASSGDMLGIPPWPSCCAIAAHAAPPPERPGTGDGAESEEVAALEQRNLGDVAPHFSHGPSWPKTIRPPRAFLLMAHAYRPSFRAPPPMTVAIFSAPADRHGDWYLIAYSLPSAALR